ncbi:MAG TPA: excisionase family DNA-binding protein [Mycobacterium sp.]|jgi:excisionase family DNA binding protein|uniref:excisionase family DNA-binding protein n=1 Tax=Mycobacterium sp. TaxID=1785 RepID=UPI002F3F78F4
MTAPAKIAYGIAAAAEAVSVSTDYIRREIHAGNLRAHMIGAKYLIDIDDLHAWVKRLPEAT